MNEPELHARIHKLSQQLLDKERELVSARTSNQFLEQDVEAVKAELGAAREELRNEATKSALLDQRLRRTNEELEKSRLDLSSCASERDALNRTLGRVSDQLDRLKSESHGKGLQLNEVQLYFESLLEAKETSIHSLQSLLESQQQAFEEQRELWEEQRRSLKATLMDLSDRVDTSQAAQGKLVGEELQGLRARLAASDRAVAEAGAREQQLLALLKDQKRRIAKLQAKQEADALGRDSKAGGRRGHGRSATADGSSGESRGADTVSSDTALGSDTADVARQVLQAALRRLSDAGSEQIDRGRLREQLQLADHALQEELRRYSKTRSRLAAVLHEGEELRAEVARLRSDRLHAEAADAAAGDVGLAEELLHAQRRIQDLEQQLRDTREAAAGAAVAKPSAAVVTPSGPGLLTSSEHLALLRQRLLRQRQEFESLLQRVAMEAAGRGGLGLPEEELSRLLERHLTRVDTLASMAALPAEHRELSGDMGSPHGIGAAGKPQQQWQHSMLVARASWSTLRRALLGLQEAVSASIDISTNPVVAYLQGSDFLSRLMKEWAVGSDKTTLDSAVETSISAAVALVQEAASRLQSHASDLGVCQQQLREAHDSVAQLRLTNGLLQQEADKHLAQVRRDAGELREDLDRCRTECGQAQVEARARGAELEATRERAEAALAEARRAEAAVAAVENERARLRRALAAVEGDKGSAEAAALAREDELLRLTRQLSDAHATIHLLHARLEAAQQGSGDGLASLKAKIRDVVSVMESPNLAQLHASMALVAQHDVEGATTAGAWPSSGLVSSRPATPRRRRGAGGTGAGAGGASGDGVLSEDALHSMALGLAAPKDPASADMDPSAAASSLVAALDRAAASCGAALQRLALLAVAHHEAEGGVAAVGAVRDHLASAAEEMAAGRLAVGEVLLDELMSMLDDGSGAIHGFVGRQMLSSSASASQWQVAAGSRSTAATGGPLLDPPLLRAQLDAARDAADHTTKHIKNVEGMLLAIKNALPEWLDLSSARHAARHRAELSRLRGLLGAQLGAVRRDLRELRADCRAHLAEAAQTAADALEQAQRASAGLERDRADAAQQLSHLTRDLAAAVDLLGDTTTTGARPAATSAAHDEAAAPPHSLAGAVAAVARFIPELVSGLERLRGELRGLVVERDDARRLAEAAATHGSLLVRAIADAVPLPDVLIRALQDASGSESSGLWCVQLRDAVAGHVDAVQAATTQQLMASQVAPLQQSIADLQAQLRAAGRRTAALQRQAARFAADSEAGLAAARRAAGEAAEAVLEGVLAGLREEVASVQSEVAGLQASSADLLRAAGEGYAAQLAAARSSSGAAVAALEAGVALLQAQLGGEADAYDALAAKKEADAKEAAERLAAESARVRGLTTELAAARERLAAVEASEGALETEARGLRKALRQRDVMVMGMLHDGGGGGGGAKAQGQGEEGEAGKGG